MPKRIEDRGIGEDGGRWVVYTATKNAPSDSFGAVEYKLGTEFKIKIHVGATPHLWTRSVLNIRDAFIDICANRGIK